jgi:hypothetical protein
MKRRRDWALPQPRLKAKYYWPALYKNIFHEKSHQGLKMGFNFLL